MNGKKLKMIILAIMLYLLMSLLIGSASAEGVTATFNLVKDPYADEMLVAGSPYAMPGVSFDHQSGEYLGAQTVITARDLLKKIENGNEFATTFAVKLGLGLTKDQVAKNLNKLVEEYDQQIAKGNLSFEEPRFVINGVNLVMNKNVEKIRLTLNADGTYSATMNGDQVGYRASIMIDADASVTIVYDEAGQTQIERRVANGKPTDFVIALDVSGSMSGDRGNAMFKALRVVLEEVLHEENNTVSIVFWAEDSAIMQLDVDHNGVQQVFSGKDGVTLEKLFDASMVDANGNVSGMSLSDATIYGIENLYRTGSVTEPDKGLTKGLELLNALTTGEGRNVGVMLFTDGTVVPGDWYTSEETIERNTVALEKQMAEQFGATLVNVSIGDEYDVQSYERYLDPNSPNYYDNSQILKDNVLYYNIPKLSNQELADKVSEMFEVAFETISMDYKALQTETITDGVLAAYGAQLIETIPAGFELVRIKGEDTSYVVNGVDENGNTTIQFNLDKIISGKDQTLSYCVIPTDAGNDIGVTAYMNASDTVLYARPVDRLNYLEEEQIIKIDLSGKEPDHDDPVRPEVADQPMNPLNVTISGIEKNILNPTTVELIADVTGGSGNYHYVWTLSDGSAIASDNSHASVPIRQAGTWTVSVRVNDLKTGEVVSATSSRIVCTNDPHQWNWDQSQDQRNVDKYYKYLIYDFTHGIDPMQDEEIVDMIRNRLIDNNYTPQQAQEVLNIITNAPETYRDLYLFSFYNYSQTGNTSNTGCYYNNPPNAILIDSNASQRFDNTFFHESGHGIQINLWDLVNHSVSSMLGTETWEDAAQSAGNIDIEREIMTALNDDVKNIIIQKLGEIAGDKLNDTQKQQIADSFVNGDNEVETGSLWWKKKVSPGVQNDSTLSDYYVKVKNQLISELQAIPYNNGSMVSDVYNGITNNKLGRSEGKVVGHDNPYWYNNNNQQSGLQLAEAWAEYFSAMIRNDTYNIDKNREYFPEATQQLESLAIRLRSYYIEHYEMLYQ